MARNPWPIKWPVGSRPHVEAYALAANASFLAGALVVGSGTPMTVDECGADPASILGVACDPAEEVIEPGKINVYIADADTIFAFFGSTNPTSSHVGNGYGVVASNGIWKIDISDTTNKRLTVVGIDTVNNLFLCKFIASIRQLG